MGRWTSFQDTLGRGGVPLRVRATLSRGGGRIPHPPCLGVDGAPLKGAPTPLVHLRYIPTWESRPGLPVAGAGGGGEFREAGSGRIFGPEWNNFAKFSKVTKDRQNLATESGEYIDICGLRIVQHHEILSALRILPSEAATKRNRPVSHLLCGKNRLLSSPVPAVRRSQTLASTVCSSHWTIRIYMKRADAWHMHRFWDMGNESKFFRIFSNKPKLTFRPAPRLWISRTPICGLRIVQQHEIALFSYFHQHAPHLASAITRNVAKNAKTELGTTRTHQQKSKRAFRNIRKQAVEWS